MTTQELERQVSIAVGQLAARYSNIYDRATPERVREVCRRLILEDRGEREPIPAAYLDAFAEPER